MMTLAARERGRSALAWTLIGIAVWLAAEFVVALAVGVIYAIVALLFDWPEDIPAGLDIPDGLKLIAYVLALGAALVSVTLVRRHLLSSGERAYPSPPPPPAF